MYLEADLICMIAIYQKIKSNHLEEGYLLKKVKRDFEIVNVFMNQVM